MKPPRFEAAEALRLDHRPPSDETLDVLRDSRWVLSHVFADQATSDQLYAWARRRLIPHVRIGRRVFFPERALGDFIAQGGLEPREDEARR